MSQIGARAAPAEYIAQRTREHSGIHRTVAKSRSRVRPIMV